MRALLLFNPSSGTNRGRRVEQVNQVSAILAAQGFVLRAEATTSTAETAAQVRSAIADGCSYVFACGGDGTVHDVLQGLTDEAALSPMPILAIIPMGTANALARHLGLAKSAVAAAHQLRHLSPHTIPVGKVEWAGRHRYFLVMAGAGPSAMLARQTSSAYKRLAGRSAYYVRAASIFAFKRFPSFHLSYRGISSPHTTTTRSVSTMAVRIENLGGLFRGLGGTARVHHPHLQLLSVGPPAWLSLPAWFLFSWLRLSRLNPFLETMQVSEFECTPGVTPIDIQADGEWLGQAPMRVTLLPNAVRLLMPAQPCAVPDPVRHTGRT